MHNFVSRAQHDIVSLAQHDIVSRARHGFITRSELRPVVRKGRQQMLDKRANFAAEMLAVGIDGVDAAVVGLELAQHAHEAA